MGEALCALRDHERMSFSDHGSPNGAVRWLRAFREIDASDGPRGSNAVLSPGAPRGHGTSLGEPISVTVLTSMISLTVSLCGRSATSNALGSPCRETSGLVRQSGVYGAATICCRCRPRPAMPSSITSPGCRYRGGVIPIPTPGGVPVLIRSPGFKTMNWLI